MTEEKTAIMQFPAEVKLKILGLANDNFEVVALGVVRQFFPDLKENAIQQRLSKDSKYLSLSIVVKAESQAQLDELYQALTKTPEVLVAL